MEEVLSLDNIISGDDIDNLFTDDTSNTSEAITEDNNTTEVNVDTLFTDIPESVGSEDKDNQEGVDTDIKSDNSTSPKTFYSSIAAALRDEGILPDLDDTTNIKTPEDFASAIEAQLQARLDEKQRRVDEALNVGVDKSEIREFENTIQYLDDLKESAIEDESDKGEQLRKQLIYQDFINKGFSQERAQRETQKSFTAGTDIEDAKEALGSNKEFFQSQYNNVIEEAKQVEQEVIKERSKRAEELKNSILNTEEFDGITLDKSTRQKIYDNVSKPIFKDKNGNYYTAIQKYEMDNREDFIKKLGIIFTLTNGFKSMDTLVKSKVNKETRKSIRELEHVLSNTSRNKEGNLRFVSGIDDTESTIGYNLDV